jgi:hypothetical protein
MKKYTTLFAIAWLTCAAMSVWLWRELRVERARASALQEQVAQMRAEQARDAAQSRDKAKDVAKRDTASTPTQTQTAANSEAAGPATTAAQNGARMLERMKRWNAFERGLLRKPGYREANRARRTLEMKAGMSDLASALQVSQEDADRLIELLVDRELDYLSTPHPNPRNQAEMKVRVAEIAVAEQEQNAAIAALIGDAGVAKWKDYQASMPTRTQMRELRTTLAGTGEPLRAEQMEPLIAAVHAERKRLNDEILEYRRNNPDGGAKAELRYTDQFPQRVADTHHRIHASAAAILSPQQLATLDSMLERLRLSEAAQIQMERMMVEQQARDKVNMAKSD